VASLLAPVCLWETLHHLAHLEPRAAFRRWGGGVREALAGEYPRRVVYPWPTALARAWNHHFELVRRAPHGLVLPPPHLDRTSRRGAALLGRLEAWDRRLAGVPALAGIGGHYLVEFRRRPVVPVAMAGRVFVKLPLAREAHT
jgi:hypothetical protein